MILSFDDILEKEKGKVGIVCGTGGSLKEYHSEFENLSKNEKDKYCFISCNEWNQKTNIDVDYWVIANSVFTVEREINTFNSTKAMLIYADSVDTTDKKFIEKNLLIDYLPYDERHFKNKQCQSIAKCCKNIVFGRKTIQEYLRIVSGYEQSYRSCGTVGIHMLAISVILGCNPIYVIGIDMNKNIGYVDDSIQVSHGDISSWSNEFGTQAKIIVDSAKKIGIEIIQLSNFAEYYGIKVGKFEKK